MNLIKIAQAGEHEEIVAIENTVEQDLHTEVGHGGGQTEEGLLASLGLNGQLFAFQLLNFAIVALILWFLILKPLTKTLSERQKRIEESLDNAEKVEKNLKESEKKYQEKVDEAKVEANRIVEKASLAAEKTGVTLKEKAKQEIEQLVKQAKKNIEIEKQEMIEGLKKETVDLVVLALEKVLSEKIDEKGDKKLVEEALKKIK